MGSSNDQVQVSRINLRFALNPAAAGYADGPPPRAGLDSDVVLVRRLSGDGDVRIGWRARRIGARRLAGVTQMVEDGADGLGVIDERDDPSAAAAAGNSGKARPVGVTG